MLPGFTRGAPELQMRLHRQCTSRNPSSACAQVWQCTVLFHAPGTSQPQTASRKPSRQLTAHPRPSSPPLLQGSAASYEWDELADLGIHVFLAVNGRLVASQSMWRP